MSLTIIFCCINVSLKLTRHWISMVWSGLVTTQLYLHKLFKKIGGYLKLRKLDNNKTLYRRCSVVWRITKESTISVTCFSPKLVTSLFKSSYFLNVINHVQSLPISPPNTPFSVFPRTIVNIFFKLSLKNNSHPSTFHQVSLPFQGSIKNCHLFLYSNRNPSLLLTHSTSPF